MDDMRIILMKQNISWLRDQAAGMNFGSVGLAENVKAGNPKGANQREIVKSKDTTLQMISAKAKKNQLRKPISVSANSRKQNPIETCQELASISGVGENTITRVKYISAKAKENLKLSGGRGVKGRQNSADLNPVKTSQELASIANVSHDTITKVKYISAKAKENLRTAKPGVRGGSPPANSPEAKKNQLRKPISVPANSPEQTPIANATI